MLQHYNVCITYTHIMQGTAGHPEHQPMGLSAIQRRGWSECIGKKYLTDFTSHERSALMAFIFGSYLRSSRSVYGSVTHNSLTFDHEPEYLLCVGCGNYDGCCSVELDLIFTPVDKSVLCQCLNTRFAPQCQCSAGWWCQSGMWDVTDLHDGVNTEHIHRQLCGLNELLLKMMAPSMADTLSKMCIFVQKNLRHKTTKSVKCKTLSPERQCQLS